jgi:hypothetical protein
MLVALWLAVCSGLYLIGSLHSGNPATPAGEAAPKASPVPASSLQPQRRVAAAVNPGPQMMTPSSAAKATAPLKPLRDRHDLAVFGTGIERGPDLSTAESPDEGSTAGSQAPGDQN